jgi:hypothetical protein
MSLFDLFRTKPPIAPKTSGGRPESKDASAVSKPQIFYWSLSLRQFGDPGNLSDWLVLGSAVAESDGNGGIKYKSEFSGPPDIITVVEIDSAHYWKKAFDNEPSLMSETIEQIQSLQHGLGVDYILDKEPCLNSDEPIIQASVTVTVAYMLSDLDSYNAGAFIKASAKKRAPHERAGSLHKILRLTSLLQRQSISRVIMPKLHHHIINALASWPRKDKTGS